MGSLSYVCWAFCLAQVAVVYARPEFGTSLQFDESPNIREVTMRISGLLDAMDDDLAFELSGQIDGSEAQRDLLASFVENLSEKGRDVTDAFLSTVDANSGVFSAFGPLLSAYDELISFINANNQAFYSAVQTSFSRLVAEELMDSFADALDGLLHLRETLEDLQNALEAEPNSSSSEELDVRHQLLLEVLQTLFTIGSLNAVICVFQRVAHNMQTADSFYVAYKTDVNALGAHLASDLSSYGGEVLELAYSAIEKFEYLSSLYDTLGDQLSGQEDHSSASTSQSAYGALLSSVHVFSEDGPIFLQILLFLYVPAALDGYLNGVLATFEANYYQSPGLHAVADVLVEETIDSDVFAELCFAKYAGLVADVPTLGRLRLHECLDTERPRLRKLARVARSFVKLLSYDVEDLYLNLEPCLKRKSHRHKCFSQLTEFYTNLGAEHGFKYAALLGLIETELHAGRTRLEICAAAANYYTFCNLVPTLIDDMEECFEDRYCTEGCDSNESGSGRSGTCSDTKALARAAGESEMGSGMGEEICSRWVTSSELGSEMGSGMGKGWPERFRQEMEKTKIKNGLENRNRNGI